MPAKTEAKFSGSIPENYDRYLGPLLMIPFGRDMAMRLPIHGLNDVLELACGTGIVTKILRERLAEETRLVATDISEGMLGVAKSKQMEKKVEWKAADATSLPIKDGSFDMVVCQFGVMFFPDKNKAMSEIFRVLRPGGRVLFNVWDKLKFNDFARIAHHTIEQMFDNNPPEFYNLAFGFNDYLAIRTLLRQAGFSDIAMSTVEKKVQADAADAAQGFVNGNPIVEAIRDKLGKDPKEAAERVERAMASELGQRIAKGQARAIVVGARKAQIISAGSKAAVAEPAPKAKATPKPKTKAAK